MPPAGGILASAALFSRLSAQAALFPSLGEIESCCRSKEAREDRNPSVEDARDLLDGVRLVVSQAEDRNDMPDKAGNKRREKQKREQLGGFGFVLLLRKNRAS